jgi:hypothetical protein
VCTLSTAPDVSADSISCPRWAPIAGGTGHGRLRFSVLFKPLDLILPRRAALLSRLQEAPPLIILLLTALLEWNVGTVEVLAARITGFKGELGARLSFEVESSGKASASSIIGLNGEHESSGNGFDARSFSSDLLTFLSLFAGEASAREVDFSIDEPLSIPVFSRSAPMIVKLNSSHSLLRRTDAGSAALWFNTIAGAEEELEVQLPLDS